MLILQKALNPSHTKTQNIPLPPRHKNEIPQTTSPCSSSRANETDLWLVFDFCPSTLVEHYRVSRCCCGELRGISTAARAGAGAGAGRAQGAGLRAGSTAGALKLSPGP